LLSLAGRSERNRERAAHAPKKYCHGQVGQYADDDEE
jgi:hypothetical protein